MSRESGAELVAPYKKTGSYVGIGEPAICRCLLARCKFYGTPEEGKWLVCNIREGQHCPLTAEFEAAEDW